MNLIPVVSSNVDMIGYANGIIEVHFLNGYVYQYSGTNQALFDEFLNSSSKGRFVHQRLKDQYATTRIR